jgi:hypothetical protein
MTDRQASVLTIVCLLAALVLALTDPWMLSWWR